MKKIQNVIGVMLLIMAFTACHENSDVLQAYDHNDELVFSKADSSFAAKFEVTWNGMNQYYGIWDYEESLGVDWDAVYDTFKPKFAALDARDKNTDPVSNAELQQLLEDMLGPLHDGHLDITWKNHHRKDSTVSVSPGYMRVKQREDYAVANGFVPNLTYYRNATWMENDADGQLMTAEGSTAWNDHLQYIRNTEGIGMLWLADSISKIDDKASPTEHEEFLYNSMKKLRLSLALLTASDLNIYNQLVAEYSYLNVPGLINFNPGEQAVIVKSALFKGASGGSIAYLYLSSFFVSPSLEKTSSATNSNQIADAWNLWFDQIQDLHKKGKLEGVIIDVRSNNGGATDDEAYALGALLPAGGYQYGWARVKRGTARHEYSPLMPAIVPTMSKEHEVIDDKPVVMLTNCSSISMAELTCLMAQRMSNGNVIGKRTSGGFCGINDNITNSKYYAGHIGVNNVTSVQGYVPSQAVLNIDKQFLEGIGIIPDIEVDMDKDAFEQYGKDTQLERALEFIKTGK